MTTTVTAPSIYEEIGATPLINACGHKTVLGGSTPSPAGEGGDGARRRVLR